MTVTDNAAPTMPAEAARLAAGFDPARLLADLDAVRTHQWKLQRYFGDGVGAQAEVDWRILPLRSPGGDPSRTDPGGPGSQECADTEWLARTPYLREVLAAVPAPLRAVRLMALGPGAVSDVHNDTKYGPAWGVARLHVPITTHHEATLVLDGVTHRWQPGEFWFGDFSRMHKVENTGSASRVHMVVDCLTVPELAAVFPAGWQEYFAHGEVLLNRPETPYADDPSRLARRFQVPPPFADWEEEGEFPDAPERVQAEIAVTPGGVELRVAPDQSFPLVHIADAEFRFAGWSQERTLQLLDGPRAGVVLRTRVGREVRELAVNSKSVEPS
ncbi:aspartyl/asparaginyl beta-hydroxylase domain-containing protein [Streptomyces sp. NPDC003280]|uniref:aspartyl/asparaginyl beta-hydroxylase domain-containing protein n=1 Tax=Streptomyces sp. NPDC003280 TaxID=3364680 RepID=UPI003688EE67